jgi:hypothetical protein
MDKLNSYQPGQTAFPAIGGHPAINDASQGGYKDSVLNAVAHYKDALRNMQNVGSSGSAGVRQSDVDQAAQAMKSEQGGSGGSLKQQAADAISRGANAEAVKARYKELTGQDL